MNYIVSSSSCITSAAILFPFFFFMLHFSFVFCCFYFSSISVQGSRGGNIINRSFRLLLLHIHTHFLTGCLLFETVGPCRSLLHGTETCTTPSYIKWKSTVKSTQVNLMLAYSTCVYRDHNCSWRQKKSVTCGRLFLEKKKGGGYVYRIRNQCKQQQKRTLFLYRPSPS